MPGRFVSGPANDDSRRRNSGAGIAVSAEQVWAGKKTAKEALDSAVKRGNELLVRFEAANK